MGRGSVKPGDVVTWDSPQRGPVQATLIKYLEPTNSWSVQIDNGWAKVFAIAQPRHLRSPQCPCADPGDCQGCAA